MVELDAKDQEKKHRQELEEAKELVNILYLSGQNLYSHSNVVFNISPFDITKYNTRYETSV